MAANSNTGFGSTSKQDPTAIQIAVSAIIEADECAPEAQSTSMDHFSQAQPEVEPIKSQESQSMFDSFDSSDIFDSFDTFDPVDPNNASRKCGVVERPLSLLSVASITRRKHITFDELAHSQLVAETLPRPISISKPDSQLPGIEKAIATKLETPRTWPERNDEYQLESFHLFVGLPEDIRLMIWEIVSWTASRVYQVRIYPPNEVVLRSDFPSPILQLCTESRNEALRSYRLSTQMEAPRQISLDCPSPHRIFNPIKLPHFSFESNAIAISLLDLNPFPEEYDKRQLFSKIVQDNDVRYVHIYDVFVPLNDMESGLCALRNQFPPYLLHNYIRGLRIGFFVPREELDDEELGNSIPRFHMSRQWVPASGACLSSLLDATRLLIRSYCAEKNRSNMPFVDSVR